jgi:hypothetical protein
VDRQMHRQADLENGMDRAPVTVGTTITDAAIATSFAESTTTVTATTIVIDYNHSHYDSHSYCY